MSKMNWPKLYFEELPDDPVARPVDWEQEAKWRDLFKTASRGLKKLWNWAIEER